MPLAVGRLRWLIGATVLVWSVSVPIGQASFPGRNGRLAVASWVADDCGGRGFTVRPDGSHRRRLTSLCRNRDWLEGFGDPAWSRDGRKIAFRETRGDPYGVGVEAAVSVLAIMAAD